MRNTYIICTVFYLNGCYFLFNGIDVNYSSGICFPKNKKTRSVPGF